MDFTPVGAAAAIVSITVGGIAILGFLASVWMKLQKLIGNIDIFMVDWTGSDERPGRDKVPGVMERLNKIDGELKHNGGSTMKDAVKRIETKLDRIEERIEKGDQRFQEGNERFEELNQRIEEIEGKLEQ
jgi:predicted ribosome quality control (RQC) complex YloA/Tae2 family protein